MTLYILGDDAGSMKIITPDDSTVEISGVVLQIKDAGVDADALAAAVAGVGLTGGAGSALALDIHEVPAEDIDASADFIIFDDATDDSTKRESIADLMTAVADGSTIEASSGVLSVKSGVYMTNPSYAAGEGLAKGDAVYIKSDGKVWKAKADSATTMPCVGFAEAAAEAEASVSIIGPGQIMEDVSGGGAFTVGGECWVSAATAGEVTQTAPVGSANVQQSVGRMKDADDLHVIIGAGILYPSA